MTRFLALALSFALFAGISQAQSLSQTPAGDPAARETVIDYGGPEPVVVVTDAGPVTFSAEIADTEARRQRGLMWREDLAEDAGMLFDFEQVRPVSIWMRNTLIPLDILYIREDGMIAKIIAHAQPRSERQLLSGVPVLSVLEIKAGRAAELGIEPGDLVRHRLFGTQDGEPQGAGEPAGDDSAQGQAQPQEG